MFLLLLLKINFLFQFSESLTQRNDCALFGFGSTTKKRPNNLILGRIFENEILDMVELGLEKYKSIADFKNEKIGTCVKPCLMFNGPKWSHTDELRRLRNLLIDVFQKDNVEHVRLQGIEHVLSFTCTEDMTILMRSYRILLKVSGERTPRIELEEIGPSADFSVRRSKIASEDLFKQACKQPKVVKAASKKNVTIDSLGNTMGRVHLGKQELGKIQTRQIKGLKKSPEEKRAAREEKKELLKNALNEMIKSTDN